jgi:DNA-binding transcriptional LysR family regulator
MFEFPTDVSQLAVLRELASRGSITDVAIATHKSPSAISQQLKTLQRQLGVVLVERSGRGVRLTDAGRTLADSSIRIATVMAEAQATWDSFHGGATGSVRVAMIDSASELLIPGLLTRMKGHEGIELQAEIRDVSQDEFAPLTADFDIVVSHRSDDLMPPAPADVEVVALMREPLDVAVPLDHPLASRARVAVDEFIGDDWIGVPAGYPIDRVLMTMARQSGIAPTVVYRTTHLPLIENLVAAGLGVGLVPRYTSLARSHGRFALLEIANVQAGRHVEALLRPDRAARLAVQTVLRQLVAEARNVTER